MFNHRISLIICIILASIGILWLGPITGATFNGRKTFLLSIEQAIILHPKCDFQYSSGATFCINSYNHAYDLGIIVCGLLGLLILVCIFLLIRIEVRKQNPSSKT
jgi:hypothetical protein